MPYHEHCLKTPDGLRLCEKAWLPDGEARGAVVLVHGIFEHSGRYDEVAGELNRQGFAFHSMDLRGHGKSDGERAWVEVFDEFLADLDLLLDRVRRQHPGKPLFLMGHSMGGAVVTLYTILRRPDISGLILSAPAILVGGGVFPFLRRLAGVVSALFPRLKIVRMGSRRLSRDPEVIQGFRNDPLVFQGKFPVRIGAEVLRACRRIGQRMDEIALPLLILHGTGDVVTDPDGSRRLYDCSTSPDKTLKLYDGLYHDLFHEPEKGQILADVLAWLDARVAYP